MLGRLLRVIQRIASSPAPSAHGSAAAEQRHYTVQLPLGGQPLCRVELQTITEPVTGGERTRIRAHVQTRIGSVLLPALRQTLAAQPRQPPAAKRAALPADAASSAPTKTLPARASRLAQQALRSSVSRALRLPVIRRIADPLLRLDLDTWVELNASDAPLDAGSRELLPQAQRLAELGIRPQPPGDQPQAQTWVMEAPDGFAQVSILQIDGHQLSAALRSDTAPMSLALAIVNSVKRV